MALSNLINSCGKKIKNRSDILPLTTHGPSEDLVQTVHGNYYKYILLFIRFDSSNINVIHPFLLKANTFFQIVCGER